MIVAPGVGPSTARGLLGHDGHATGGHTHAVHKIAGEVLGTFVLVFFGCGAALISGGDYVATALAFGLTVVVMAYAVGRITGGHFNPAVTLGAALGGRLPWREVVLYIGSQLVGAVAAGVCLWVLMHGFPGYDSTTDGLAQNFFGDQGATDYAWWAAFLLEMLMTFVFIMIILAVTDSRVEHPVMAPLAIGLALAMIHFASINATGTSVNPARSIGVGLFAGTDAIIQLWLFILAPLLGGGAGRPALPRALRRRRPGARLGPALRPRAARGRGARLRRPGPVPAAVEPARRAAHRAVPQQQPGQQPQHYAPPAAAVPAPAAVRRLPVRRGPVPAAAAVPAARPAAVPAAAVPAAAVPPAAVPPPQQYPQQYPPQQLPAAGRLGAAGRAAPPQTQETPPQEWGQPGPDDEDGRTQVRPQDS